MASVIRTNLCDVLDALEAVLRSSLSFPAERVLSLALGEPAWEPHGDQFLTVRAQAQGWDPVHIGSGRIDSRVKRACVVTLWTRMLLDETTQDRLWLRHLTMGHYRTEHKLFNALEELLLEKPSGDALLYAPIMLRACTEAEKEKKRDGWGASSVAFDLCFILDLTQTLR